MNNTQKQFVTIFSDSIRNKKTTEIYNNVDWKVLLDLAKAHKVDGIIYAGLSKSNLLSNIDEDEIKTLKRTVFNVGARQALNIKNLSNIFNKFNEVGIPVIVLKGLVVRDFYPHPTQRSMGDADVLVKKDDVEKAKQLLIDMGYVFLEDHKASHHIALVHSVYPMIELHWNLFKRDGFSDELENYEELIWNDAIKVKVGEAEVLSLGYEDITLHLCMHMAAHLASTGFGLRLVSDLVLLIEKKKHEINWVSFLEKARLYKFEKFSLTMFSLCKELFNMELPKGIQVDKINNRKYISALINEIFESGVHGKKDMTSKFGTQVAFNFEDKDGNATLGAIKRYFRFIFPNPENMSKQYNYSKKYKILTPIAWIHHLFAGIFSSKYSFKDKFSFMTKGASVAVKRNKLLSWLEL